VATIVPALSQLMGEVQRSTHLVLVIPRHAAPLAHIAVRELADHLSNTIAPRLLESRRVEHSISHEGFAYCEDGGFISESDHHRGRAEQIVFETRLRVHHVLCHLFAQPWTPRPDSLYKLRAESTFIFRCATPGLSQPDCPIGCLGLRRIQVRPATPDQAPYAGSQLLVPSVEEPQSSIRTGAHDVLQQASLCIVHLNWCSHPLKRAALDVPLRHRRFNRAKESWGPPFPQSRAA
jgi:hypothetical protein